MSVMSEYEKVVAQMRAWAISTMFLRPYCEAMLPQISENEI